VPKCLWYERQFQGFTFDLIPNSRYFAKKVFQIIHRPLQYTLYDLNEHIRRVLALNFPESLWVSCEIGQLGQSRGHYYLTLVQKAEEDDELIAQAEAVLWAGQYRKLRRQTGAMLSSLLREGIEVLLQVRLDFHERYGLKLIIDDIDPSYTMGKMEQRRRQIIEQLKAGRLLEKNGRLPLPVVLQRIAVISSEEAAGLQDFLRQLERNAYGYRFHTRLFPAAVQGEQVELEMLRQLQRISRKGSSFDCVVIIRGGGSRLDLTGFDNLALGRAIAGFPLPVLTGIGHDIDETVADLVAHTALKTPTAAADFLIAHNLHFESRIEEWNHRLQLLSQRLLRHQQLQMGQLEQLLQLKGKQALASQNNLLNFIEKELPRLSRHTLRDQQTRIEQMEHIVRLLNPEATFRRGYTLTLKEGRLVSSANTLKEGDRITTQFRDGSRTSVIKNGS
jgi:exodeoxyribonuclease VII large subunit